MSRPPSHPLRPATLRLETLEDRIVPSTASNLLDLSGLTLNPSQYDPSHILVQFRAGATPGALLAGTSLGERLDLVSGLFDVDLSASVSVEQALLAYRNSPSVLTAEPDATITFEKLPNDPSFGSVWALNNTGQGGGKVGADIKAPAGWDVTTGNRKIVVSVMDTGIDYNHPDLYQNIWINQKEIPASRRANLIDEIGRAHV